MIDWRMYLVRQADVCTGQVCAKGTRIPVTVILANLAEGLKPEQLLAQYPSLSTEHIEATLAYAADLAEEELLLPLSDL